jgi:hypothetical protein
MGSGQKHQKKGKKKEEEEKKNRASLLRIPSSFITSIPPSHMHVLAYKLK